MTAVPSREITTAQIASVGFSFYTDEEVRKLSVKHLQSPLTLDNLKQPVPGGLYDPALGPLGMFDTCATCGLRYRACPGHFGHVELAVPVYHPLVFGTLYKLLRCVCLHCFKFRLASAEVEKFRTKMQLIAEGNLEDASRIVINPGAVSKAVQEMVDAGEKDDDLKLHGGSVSTEERANNGRKRSRGCETVHTIEAARDCQLDFFRRMPTGACQNCNAHSPVIKRESGCKIFQKPLDVKKLTSNKLNGTEIVSALAGIAHSEHEAQELEEQIAEQTAEEARLAKMQKKEKDFVEQGASAAAEEPSGPTDNRQRYVTTAEVREIMRRLWEKETDVLQFCYALDPRFKTAKLPMPGTGSKQAAEAFKNVYQMFFVQTVAVPPNNVRPVSKMGDITFENPQNVALTQIINYNLDLMTMNQMSQQIAEAAKTGEELGPVGGIDIGRSLRLWLNLQNSLNGLYDTTSAEGTAAGGQGIRQLLEKKEGLFRKNMMGKRVNFACRSVISPDPYLGSGELGLPPYFAVRLSVPERVTPLNVQQLRQQVINGPYVHPGANAVEDENGRVISLSTLDLTKREAIAKQLLTRQGTVVNYSGAGQGMAGKIVYRHVHDGDIVLTNRQPTLHKPGLMAHRARILKGERTIRMHYANCATFNADFDGDEINVHIPQDLLGRSEGYNIVHADHQYIVPTDGKPIRGLIQDHVVAGVLLTKRDTFLEKDEFMQLVYSAVCPTRPGLKDGSNIEIPLPAIFKPKPLWTGKQVISAVIKRLTRGKAPMSLTSKCKTSEKYWGKSNNEEDFVFQTGDLVTGVMDKAQYGKFGLIHSVQTGYRAAEKKISGPSSNLAASYRFQKRLKLLLWKNTNGFTCGIGDLLLQPSAESTRVDLIADAERRATCASAEYAGVSVKDISEPGSASPGVLERKQAQIEKALGEKYRTNKLAGAVHDRKVTSSVQPISSEVVDVCLPNGQIKPFPQNCLSLMTVTGAKGSQVNFSQISCLLGQQELEGRRVPRMASGKTLPCFGPYEGGARSGGYVSDRFLTGLRPQEYYFHCMAGREGLVDTTVKTSRSGYLQRCLVKNLESLRTNYDGTVRDSCDGSVVQFQYGEDGIDVLNSSFLNEWNFLSNNISRLRQQEIPGSQTEVAATSSLASEEKQIAKENRARQKQLVKSSKGRTASPDAELPISGMHFSTRLGATSERFQDKLGAFVRSHPESFTQTKGKKRKLEEAASPEALIGNEDEFRLLMNMRYMRALAPPGEAVGVIAAQSVGEPSTQMTLNTFHMAGRGEANVTLGIPRLRELFMTASKSIKTPVMTMPLNPGKTKDDAEELVNRLRRVKLAEVLEDISIEEGITGSEGGAIARKYTIRLKCIPESKLPTQAGITFLKISETFRTEFMRQLKAVAKKELDAFEKNAKISTMTVTDTPAKPVNESEDPNKAKVKTKDDEDENAETNEEFDEGKLRFAGGRSEKGAMYDVGDEEDKNIAKQQEAAAKLRDEMPEGDQEGKGSNQEDVDDGIEKCYIIDGPKDPSNPDAQPPPALQTDGISFQGAWSNDDILDVNRITTNDVGSILSTYGVEAARATLMREVSSVFGAYGIAVDPRHLGLIADFMTHQGGYRACSRLGIESSRSTFLKITFETASHFMTDATLKGAADDLSSPASRIVVGRIVDLGTGTFSLRQRLEDSEW